MPETSLKHLMASCEDFEEEESLLQFYGHEMDVIVDRTPKCHCELAGEGIKYTWGCSKNYYHSRPLAAKKGKENFKTAVAACLDSNVILRKERIWKFSRRAHQYICAYYKIHLEAAQTTTTSTEAGQTTTTSTMVANHDTSSSPVNVEKMRKLFKTHCCAMDFDSNFCKVSFKAVVD